MIHIHELNLMISKVKKFKKIFITGPQRGGTRICSKIVAEETGYNFVDEKDINFKSLNLVCQIKEESVIQCPSLSSICHLFDFPDSCVVFMIRNINDILLSQERIEWTGKIEKNMYFTNDGHACKIKYNCWNNFQKKLMILPFFEFNYNSLKTHKLWINKDLRKNFKWDQTK